MTLFFVDFANLLVLLVSAQCCNRDVAYVYKLLVQACLRAPPVVADEAKLAIVFTYFFLFLLLSHFGESPIRENLFPLNILAELEEISKKNISFLDNFYFF